jgi:hypothetical protein
VSTSGPRSAHTKPASEGRRAQDARRRGRVLAAIEQAGADSTELSVSAIARAAGVDRSYLYRHRDLLEQLHATDAQPPATGGTGVGPGVTRASLQADLLGAQARSTRLAARVHQLENRLSQTLGEQVWRTSGLGAPADIDALQQQIVHLEQTVLDLRLQLAERTDDLTAARIANRELMLRANHPGT